MNMRSSALATDRRVQIGSRVHYRDEAEAQAEQITIVLESEADFTRSLISADSPLGRALVGRHIGERVKVRTPGGPRALCVLGVAPLASD
jgi:transcription elongation GreA/GreB family factor